MQASRTSTTSPWPAAVSNAPDMETCKVWHKPPMKWVKMNFDGELDEPMEVAGVGFIVRDSEAEILIAGCRFLYRQSVAATKAYALLEGLKAAVQCNPNSRDGIIIEGDCLEVFKWLQGAEATPQGMASIVNETRGLLATFKEAKFSYIPKGRNRPARWLAGEACRYRSSYVWESAYPSRLLELCMRDVIVAYADG